MVLRKLCSHICVCVHSLVAQKVKESTCNAGDLGSVPGLGRSSGEGKGYPLQYSGLENSMDCVVHGVAKSWTQLSDFHFSLLPKGFPSGASSKEPLAVKNAGDVREWGLIPGLGRSPREGMATHSKYSCLENPMDGPW